MLSINRDYIKINFWECLELNLWPQGEKQKCYLYAMQPPDNLVSIIMIINCACNGFARITAFIDGANKLLIAITPGQWVHKVSHWLYAKQRLDFFLFQGHFRRTATKPWSHHYASCPEAGSRGQVEIGCAVDGTLQIKVQWRNQNNTCPNPGLL